MQPNCKHECLICRLEAEARALLAGRLQHTEPDGFEAPQVIIPRKKRGGRGHGLTPAEKQQIASLASQGHTQTAIAIQLNVSKTTVGRILGALTPPQHRHP